MQLDLSRIETAIAALRTGVANLITENRALREAIDPTAQARINAEAAALEEIAATIPVIPDPGTP